MWSLLCHFWGGLLLTEANAQPNVSKQSTSLASQIRRLATSAGRQVNSVKMMASPTSTSVMPTGHDESVAGEKRPEKSGFDMARSPRHAEPLTMGLYSTPSVATAWVLGGIRLRVAQIEDERKTKLTVLVIS